MTDRIRINGGILTRVAAPHLCNPPNAGDIYAGSTFKCDCGQKFERRVSMLPRDDEETALYWARTQ